MAWTDPKTWATNDILSASDLNTYVRDNGRAIGKLTSYTPSWTASTTNPVIGNGVIQGRYIALEEWCWVSVQISVGTTTTVGSGNYSVSLPFAGSTLSGGTEQNLAVALNHLGVARFYGIGVIFTGGTTFVVNGPTLWSAGTQQLWGNTTPFSFGGVVGNTMNASGIYRRV
jgi:hypothetical protein